MSDPFPTTSALPVPTAPGPTAPKPESVQPESDDKPPLAASAERPTASSLRHATTPTRPAPSAERSVLQPDASISSLPGPSAPQQIPESGGGRGGDRTFFAANSSSSAYGNPDADTSASPSPPAEELEMDSLTPGGHRRRRSSLINPANSAHGHHRTGSHGHQNRSSRPRAPSLRNPVAGQEEPKIAEENSGAETNLLSPTPEMREEEDFTDEDLHDDEETGLTRKDKRRKKSKRKNNTRLDQRIIREKISDDERKESNQSVIRQILVNCGLISLWYIFSLCISLYNKWMFDPQNLNFPFPLFTTSIHMLVQFTLASLVLWFIPSFRPHNAHMSNMGQSRHETDTDRPLMTKMFYLTRIGPCGAATGLDIGLGNTSLKFITLTFYTMCKSSSLAFVLIFAFLFRLESPTWKLITIIATMTLGVIMMVAGEVEFKLGGFILVISAAFFSGFRWGLTQILLLRNPATSNPFSSIFFLAPVMFLTLIAIAIPVEGIGALIEGLRVISETWGLLMTPLLIIFPGTIAFLMTASEFALLRRTSVVTLSIAGIFKEAVTISAAALVFGDKLTPVNFVGLFVTLGSIVAYNWIKISKMRNEAQAESRRRNHMEHNGTDDASSAFAISSPSTSGSDAEGEDGHDETAGLLRQSVELGEVLFTADGEMIPKPEASPLSVDSGRADKGERED